MSEVLDGYDVVVVGSGGGAMTGALLAQRAGLRSVVLEKTALVGGTSAYSGGACWLPGSAVQHPTTPLQPVVVCLNPAAGIVGLPAVECQFGGQATRRQRANEERTARLGLRSLWQGSAREADCRFAAQRCRRWRHPKA